MTESLLILLALGALAWYWLDGARAREIGVIAARQACQKEGLQFLDDSVVQNGLRGVRNELGQLVLQRSFAFEYSRSGDDRLPGLVMLQADQVVLLQLGESGGARSETDER